MENNKNNRNKKSSIWKILDSTGTVMWSFVIALVAVVSLIAFGFNQPSYAIPDVTSPLGDSFTAGTPQASDRIISDTGFNVTKYSTSTGDHVYCLEHNIAFGSGSVYEKKDSITDYGLLYIMANTYPNVQMKDKKKNDGSNLSEDFQVWISQTAIWVYLAETNAENNTIEPADLEKIKTASCVYTSQNSSYCDLPQNAEVKHNLYNTYIKDLVEQAKAQRTVPNKQFKANLSSTDISITNNNEYYQSDAVTVTGSPSDNFNSFKVEISSAPEGTILVDEKGAKLSSYDNLPTGTKFYVRVPVNKVTEENKKVKLSFVGSFKTYEGNYYVSTGKQTITSVKTVNNNVSTGLEFELNYTPDVPNTGMSTAQTIYFIGLIVLLSGVGIIYANAKPTNAK